LLVIGRDCAAHLKEPYRSINHGDMLYEEHGLRNDSRCVCHHGDSPR
jgi:hypothetical protein